MLALLLSVAAILGNTLNYSIGRFIGTKAFSGHYRFIKVDYLRQTERYFQRHGALTIVLSRFAPIIRTFAPFVAGIGHMGYGKFQGYNVLGALLWVNLLTWAGYFFGNLPLVRDNFGLVTIGIIVVSMLPMVVMMVIRTREPRRQLAEQLTHGDVQHARQHDENGQGGQREAQAARLRAPGCS